MEKITAVRKISFDYGHRINRHESKCANAHGHTGLLEIYASADKLDKLGRVIDFSVLKDRIKTWVDAFWDHNFLVHKDDDQTIKALISMPRTKEPFICEWNPTAENMASYILNTVCPDVMQGTDVTVYKVVMHETPNCFAVVEL